MKGVEEEKRQADERVELKSKQMAELAQSVQLQSDAELVPA